VSDVGLIKFSAENTCVNPPTTSLTLLVQTKHERVIQSHVEKNLKSLKYIELF